MNARIDISHASFTEFLKWFCKRNSPKLMNELLRMNGYSFAAEIPNGQRLQVMTRMCKSALPITASEVVASRQTNSAFWRNDTLGRFRCQ